MIAFLCLLPALHAADVAVIGELYGKNRRESVGIEWTLHERIGVGVAGGIWEWTSYSIVTSATLSTGYPVDVHTLGFPVWAVFRTGEHRRVPIYAGVNTLYLRADAGQASSHVTEAPFVGAALDAPLGPLFLRLSGTILGTWGYLDGGFNRNVTVLPGIAVGFRKQD